MKINHYLFIASALTMLTACTSTHPYPENWPSIDNHTPYSCTDTEIYYENFNDESYLSDLFNINVLGPKENSIVELRIENTGLLKITLHRDKRKPRTREFRLSKNEFTCEDGIISFKQDREFYVHQVVMATSRADVRLYNSGTNMIAKIVHKSYTLAMLVLPIKNNNVVWEKWKQTEKPDHGQTENQVEIQTETTEDILEDAPKNIPIETPEEISK